MAMDYRYVILAILIVALIIVGYFSFRSKKESKSFSFDDILIGFYNILNFLYGLIYKFLNLLLNKEDRRNAIKEAIKESAEHFPMELEDGIHLTSMVVDGEYCVHKIEVDEEVVNIGELREDEKRLRDLAMDAKLFDLKSAELGGIFNFVGSESEETITVKMEHTEF